MSYEIAIHNNSISSGNLLSSLFDDPDRESRVLYAKYWQHKLKDNPNVSFPDALVKEVADSTNRFSFAYLKEALYVRCDAFYDIYFIGSPHRRSVSALITLARFSETDKPSFATVLMAQIKALREQLDSQGRYITVAPDNDTIVSNESAGQGNHDFLNVSDTLSDAVNESMTITPSNRIYTTQEPTSPSMLDQITALLQGQGNGQFYATGGSTSTNPFSHAMMQQQQLP